MHHDEWLHGDHAAHDAFEADSTALVESLKQACCRSVLDEADAGELVAQTV
jgi:hypothetical protein